MVEECRYAEDADLEMLSYKNTDYIYVDSVSERLLEPWVSKYITE